VSYGYGKHTWDFPMQNFEHTLLLMYIAGTFAITGAIWSKTSFAVTLLRLTKGWLYWLVWFLLVTTNVFLGLSALFNWVQCTPVEKTWKVSAAGTCWSMSALVKYHIFSGGSSIVTRGSMVARSLTRIGQSTLPSWTSHWLCFRGSSSGRCR